VTGAQVREGDSDDGEDDWEEDFDEDVSTFAKLLFNAIDLDESGTLSRVEIHMALKRYGFSEHKIDELFNVADANHDNVLSISEFTKGMVPILMQAEGIKLESENTTNSKATHYIDVSIHSCSNLPPVDLDPTQVSQKEGVCNPYVEVVLNRQRHQTRVVRETLNPVFQQNVRVFVPDSDLSREMEIRLKDWNMAAEHIVLGVVRIAVADVIEVGHILQDVFHLEESSGGGFVGHNGEPSSISLSFRAEVPNPNAPHLNQHHPSKPRENAPYHLP
jgi:hypothetical protein